MLVVLVVFLNAGEEDEVTNLAHRNIRLFDGLESVSVSTKKIIRNLFTNKLFTFRKLWIGWQARATTVKCVNIVYTTARPNLFRFTDSVAFLAVINLDL